VIWRVLSVIVAIVFALIAGFVALMLAFATSDPDPSVQGVVPVFWVMLVVSLGFTVLFIWLALRKRR
jgi:NO-binding membrane sensor protein with MHYT domain